MSGMIWMYVANGMSGGNMNITEGVATPVIVQNPPRITGGTFVHLKPDEI